MQKWLPKRKRPTCDLLLKVSCNDRPAGSCWRCSGAALLAALQLTEPTPGPAAGSTLLTNSQALGRSNRNLTCSTPSHALKGSTLKGPTQTTAPSKSRMATSIERVKHAVSLIFNQLTEKP